jgi:hypothetical protein
MTYLEDNTYLTGSKMGNMQFLGTKDFSQLVLITVINFVKGVRVK